MTNPAVSICIATYDKPKHLDRVLESIHRQRISHEYEVIVVDDGSPSDDSRKVAEKFPGVRFERVVRQPGYRNPSKARNIAYKMARGDVVIAQSDDVEHVGNAVDGLVGSLHPGTFVLANVFNTDFNGELVPCYGDWTELVGPKGRARRAIFFLGALYREDLYAVGGNEERFTMPGREDVYFGDCLTLGLKLSPVWLSYVVGHHLHHDRPAGLGRMVAASRMLYRELCQEGRWISSGAPWPAETRAGA